MEKRKIVTRPPKAAWKKELGDVDWDKTFDTLLNNSSQVDRTVVGIPLGGFGAGNFEYNLTGTFGPWQIEPSRLERRFLRTAAFHAREVRKEEKESSNCLYKEKDKIRAVTLATGSKFRESADVLTEAWQDHLLRVGEADYYALYPRGWVDYRDSFYTKLSMEFFSPIIADNYRETSLPTAYFVFHAANPGSNPVELSIMFTFPNPETLIEGEENAYRTAIIGVDAQKTEGAKKVLRKGLKNTLKETDTYAAIVMDSHSEENKMKAEGTEFCISTIKADDRQVSYVPCWDSEKDASAVWDMFEKEGTLTPFEACTDFPAGAISVTFRLAPGEEKEIPFVLSWNIPVTESGDPEGRDYQAWWRKYTAFYPPSEEPQKRWTTDHIRPQALQIAADSLENLDAVDRAISGWMNPYLENPRYKGKEWVLTAAFNELYYTAFGGSFWENGLIVSDCMTHDGIQAHRTEKIFGNRDYEKNPLYASQVDLYQQKKQCLHYTLEAQEFPFAETFDVRGHSHRSYLDLWPEIERDILLLYKDFIMDTNDKSCPHDAGNPMGAVFVAYDYYFDMMKLLNADAYPGEFARRKTTPWSEFSPKFILYSYEYWKKTNDSAFIHDVWEAITESYIYERRTDTDNDGITNMKSSEYERNELFNAILCIGAMEAILELCAAYPEFAQQKVQYSIINPEGFLIHSVDENIVSDVSKELERTRNYVENRLWNENDGYYQFNSETPIIMADAFVGECHIRNAGLKSSVNNERLSRHWKMTYACNVEPCYGKNGEGKGHCGAKNLVTVKSEKKYHTADGVIDHASDVWTGVTYLLSANMYHTGTVLNDEKLKLEALDTAHGVYFTTYEDPDTAYYFNTPEAWRADNPRYSRNRMYQRARGAWELLRAVGEIQ